MGRYLCSGWPSDWNSLNELDYQAVGSPRTAAAWWRGRAGSFA